MHTVQIQLEVIHVGVKQDILEMALLVMVIIFYFYILNELFLFEMNLIFQLKNK